jgi:DNA-binding NtrC family response regulator
MLGHTLLDRGRAHEAGRLFASARTHLEALGDTAGALRAALGVAAAWVEDGQLSAAEAVLRAIRMTAAHAADMPVATLATAALARCLFLQDELDEAAALAERVGGETSAHAASVDARLVLSEIALRRGDLPGAGAAAAAAIDAATSLADDRRAAAAHAAAARVAAAVADEPSLALHVARALAAAGRGRVPLVALQAKLARIEGLVFCGRSSEARHEARRLARRTLGGLPPLWRARVLFALACADPKAPEAGARRAEAEALARRHGARALIARPQREVDMDAVEQVIGVFELCQEAADEMGLLERVAGSLCERLHAAGVALHAAARPERLFVTVRGASSSLAALAQRACDSGVAIPPERSALEVMAAVPVRYGGAPIGGLGCRWLPDKAVDVPRALAVMTGAAAACAPALRAAVDRLLAPTPASAETADLIGESGGMHELRRAIARAADAPFPVLIEGESGTGKELVARALHRRSRRGHQRWCALNCAALHDELLEAELFGHARGAFTGAVAERPGLFEEADGGTLFLDEVGELSARAQAKLLRVLQDGEVRRLGETMCRRVDARIVAATNRSLDAEVEAGRFRKDLLYRLDVVRLRVPPLRDRPEDVPLLAAHFWSSAVSRTGSRATLDPDALALLARYDWPGNVRELQNVMASLAVCAPKRGRVAPGSLPDAIACAARPSAMTLDEARRQFEARFVRAALARAGGRRGQAASDLGLSRQGLVKTMARLGILPALLVPLVSIV